MRRKTYLPGMIEVEGLSKRFGRPDEIQALEDVSFSVEGGAVLGLLGPDGAGKTTLLRIMATLLRPSGGSVTVEGFDTVKDGDKVRELIGYVPHFASFTRNMTLRDYLNFWGMMSGLPREKRKDGSRELLELLKLDENEMVLDCSTYTCKRLWLAQALLTEPKFLIMDEPVAGLTPSEGESMAETLKLLNERGETILLSSSRLSEVLPVCNQIVAISEGRATRVYGTDALLKAVGESLHARIFVEADGIPPKALSALRDVAGVIDIRQATTATVLYVEPGTIVVEDIEGVLRQERVKDYRIKVGEITLGDVFRTLSAGG